MLEGNLQLSLGDFTLDSGAFTIPTDGVTVLFGRSGSGKSTLLRALAGLDDRARGTLRFGDQVWQDGRRILPTERRDIGFVFQHAALLPNRSVRGNLDYATRRVPRARRHGPGFDEIVDRVGISHLLDRPVTHLSGGERQRVAIARTLLSHPQLLLMDEPLSALDWRARGEILDLIEAVIHDYGIPTLYITHAPSEVERLATRVVFMERGRITGIEDLQQALSHVDSPLFVEEGPVSVLHGTLGEPDDDALVPFTAGPVTLWLTRATRPAPTTDQPVRLRILASDVSLARQPPRDISILNQLPGRITAIEAGTAGRQVVFLQLADGQQLLAEITNRSARQLQLAIGQDIHALIKSAALID